MRASERPRVCVHNRKCEGARRLPKVLRSVRVRYRFVIVQNYDKITKRARRPPLMTMRSTCCLPLLHLLLQLSALEVLEALSLRRRASARPDITVLCPWFGLVV